MLARPARKAVCRLLSSAMKIETFNVACILRPKWERQPADRHQVCDAALWLAHKSMRQLRQ